MSNIPMQGLADELGRLADAIDPPQIALQPETRAEAAKVMRAAQAALSGAVPIAWTSKSELEALKKMPPGYARAIFGSAFVKHESGEKVDVPLFAHPAPKGEAEEVLRELMEAMNAFNGTGDGPADFAEKLIRINRAKERARALTAQPADGVLGTLNEQPKEPK